MRLVRATALVGLSALGCGQASSNSSSSGQADAAADGQSPTRSVGSGGAVLSLGDSGLLYEDQQSGLMLLDNFLGYLAAPLGDANQVSILFTHDCDPRSDPDLCRRVSSADSMRGFLSVVAKHGTLEFSFLSDYGADPDVLIATGCGGLETEAERNAVLDYIEAGGRALLLGHAFCIPSVERANHVAVPLGLRFTDEDPDAEPSYWDVPDDGPLTTGIGSLYIDRITPQMIEHSFTAVLDAPTGVLAALREDQWQRWSH